MLPPCIINVILSSKKNIEILNFKWNKKKYSTDILSFEVRDNLFLNEGKLYLGDIIICMEKMKIHAKKFKTKNSTELYILIIHGIIHLIGMNHNLNKLNLIKQAIYEINVLNLSNHIGFSKEMK